MTLDRWLHRTPLEPVQPTVSNVDERDQQTAEPAGFSEQQQKAPAGTLHAYLIKLDKKRAGEEFQGDAPLRARRRASSSGGTLYWQLTGRMSGGIAAMLHHRHTAAFCQLCILESHAWQRPVLGGAPLSPEEAGSIQFASFDSQGELLVAGSEEGLITVHSTTQLLSAAAARAAAGTEPPPPAQQVVGTADPLLSLDTHLPKLQAVRWNPANENVVGVVSSTTRQLHLYDLQHTQGQPQQVLAVPQQVATAVGLTDLAFFGDSPSSSSSVGSGSGYLVLASGMGGQVFLWDARAKATPAATLQAAQCGAVYAVQLAPDQQVVLAGTQSGEVKLWDLRGGSTSTPRFGGTVHHHPLLAAFNIRYELTGVPGLASQTTIPASGVQSMQLDPCDPRRLAFHLGCGWSGVLSLHSNRCASSSGNSSSSSITHLHAPAHTYPDEPLSGANSQEGAAAAASVAQMLLWASTAAPGLHRRACWMPDGRRFCVPSRRDDSLLLLDFTASPASGCYALWEEDESAGYSNGSGSGQGCRGGPAVPPTVHVPLSQAAVCAAAHPSLDTLVAGSMNSSLSIVGLQ